MPALLNRRCVVYYIVHNSEVNWKHGAVLVWFAPELAPILAAILSKILYGMHSSLPYPGAGVSTGKICGGANTSYLSQFSGFCSKFRKIWKIIQKMLQILQKLPQKCSKYDNFKEILLFPPKDVPIFTFFSVKGGSSPPSPPPFDAPALEGAQGMVHHCACHIESWTKWLPKSAPVLAQTKPKQRHVFN